MRLKKFPSRRFLGKEKSICRRFSLSTKGSDLSGGNVDSTWSSRSMAIPSTTNMFFILRGAVKHDLRKKLGFRTNRRFFLHSRILFTKVTNFFLQIAFGAPLIQRLANSTGISLVNFANPRFLLAMHITLWLLALSSPKGVF